jgi:hypothetical protein
MNCQEFCKSSLTGKEIAASRDIQALKAAQGNATISDGDVRLDIELDLSDMATGRYLLSYRHAGESWHLISIVIRTSQN